jgi:hypothetical protein
MVIISFFYFEARSELFSFEEAVKEKNWVQALEEGLRSK